MRFAIYLVALCVPLGGPATAGEQALPAFPGAEGFGAVAVGGRGGRVIRVTNRKPAGPGSFAAALGAKGPRIIVFDVSGVIPAAGGKYARYRLGDGHVTIAGQTAPGPGITVEGQLWFRG
ncbi:MAG: right-handed parallel beta-helix repeat-containing protein, partial [Planctomycetota bacterium]